LSPSLFLESLMFATRFPHTHTRHTQAHCLHDESLHYPHVFTQWQAHVVAQILRHSPSHVFHMHPQRV
jgi:hypothetical protein